MDNTKIKDEELVKGFAKKLAFYVSNMNISSDAKELFVEIIKKLPQEKIIELSNALENKFASESLELLNLELENKLELLAIEYANEEAKIDDQTSKELDDIFKKE